MVGCASAVASGGKCGPAALAGGITSAAGPFINGSNFAANVVRNAVLGGLASVAGGGKFANGAITGAFGYLTNEMGNYQQRGYDPTMYSDGTVCNAGTASGCIMEGATPSALLENVALLLTGLDAFVGIAEGAEQVGLSLLGQSFGKLGTVVEAPELGITGFTGHGLEQVISRGVSPSDLLSTVNDPSIVLQQSAGQFLYLSDQAGVVLNPAGQVITAYPSSMFGPTVSRILGLISK